MNFLKQTYKKFKHYMNPNQNPTELDKYAFKLLEKAEVDFFIEFVQQNKVNLNALEYNSSSLLIKAQNIANNIGERRSMKVDELQAKAIKAVNYLLDKGVDIDYQDKNGVTALLAACHWENYQLAECLIKKGANPNLATKTNGFYTNPLLSAMFKKNMKIVTLLLQYNADPLKTIQLNNLSAGGFKLDQKNISFLLRAHNMINLIYRRHIEKKLKIKSILTTTSNMMFQQICLNV